MKILNQYSWKGAAAVMLAAFFVLISGCGKQEDSNVFKLVGGQFKTTGKTTFWNNGDGTMTPKDYLAAADDGYFLSWENGEEVNINGRTFTISVDDDTNATIAADGVTDIDGKYYAVYPATLELSGNRVEFSLPAEEIYDEISNTFANGEQRIHNIMAAMTTGSTMRFENLCSVLKFNVKQSSGSTASLMAIEVCSDQQLCGTMTATFDGSSWNVNTGSMAGGKVRRLKFDTPVALTATAKPFYLLMAPLSGVESFTVRLYVLTAAGVVEVYSRTKGSTASFTQSTLYNMGTIDYTGSIANYTTEARGSESLPHVVVTGSGWSALMGTSGVQTSTSVHVELWNDISVSSTTNMFKGHLDGHGHTVTLAQNIALFKQAEGAHISNVTMAGPDATEVVYYDYDSNKKCYGTIVCYSSGAHYNNCINTINITSNNEIINAIGGICGYDITNTTGTFINCANQGTINSKSTYTGGIVGNTKSSFNNCTNSGTLNVFSNAASLYLGGIAGYNNAGSSCDAVLCTNTGTINMIGIDNSSTNFNIGGIFGNANCSMSGCTNTGSITNSQRTGSGLNYCGGLVGQYTGASDRYIINCCNVSNITTTSTRPANSGGLIGCINLQSTNGMLIANCYSMSTISSRSVGGIIGQTLGTKADTIRNCYHYGDLVGTGSNIKGIVVSNSNTYLYNCYSSSDNLGSDLGSGNGTLENYTTISGGAALVDALNGGLSSGWWSWTVTDGRVVLVRP